MIKVRLLIPVVLLVIATHGCYHYRVIATESAATEYEKRTVYSLFWGLAQENIPASDCLSGGINEVRVSTNFGYALVSVATLGIVVPLDMEWRCAKEAPPDTSVFR